MARERTLWIVASGIVAVTAVGCIAYYLATGAVPVVLFFVPISRVTATETPWLYWGIVLVHGLVATVAAGGVARQFLRRPQG